MAPFSQVLILLLQTIELLSTRVFCEEFQIGQFFLRKWQNNMPKESILQRNSFKLCEIHGKCFAKGEERFCHNSLQFCSDQEGKKRPFICSFCHIFVEIFIFHVVLSLPKGFSQLFLYIFCTQCREMNKVCVMFQHLYISFPKHHGLNTRKMIQRSK